MNSTKPFHYGSERGGSLARDPHDGGRIKEDIKTKSGINEREALREPTKPITLWLCPNNCDTEYAGFLNPELVRYKAGITQTVDQTICHICGVKREAFAVISIRRVDL